MTTHQILPFVFIIVGVAYLAWSVARSRRWEKYQSEAASRAKAIVADASKSKEHFAEVMAISREQLQATKDLLAEVRGLREDLRRSGTRDV